MVTTYNDQFRHDLDPAQRRLSDTELARTLEPGVGVSVFQAIPHWDVVARIGEKGKLEFIVTDSSRPGEKPLRVFGPSTRQEAIDWAKATAGIWRATHVSHIDDEPLSQFRG